MTDRSATARRLVTTTLRTQYWERRRAGWHGTSINSLLNPAS